LRKVVSSTETYALIESTICFRNSCYLIIEIFQVGRSEHMAAEGDLLQKQVTSLILYLCLSQQTRRRWKEGKREKCWEGDWPFRFKSWNGPAIQFQTLNKLDSDKFISDVNNITMENSSRLW